MLVGGVQVAGGLVGQDDFRIVDQRAGNGHALLLAAGELRGQVMRAIGQADPIERRARFDLVGHAVEVLRQHDVLERRQVGDEMELLEDEADGFGAKAGQLGARQRGRVDRTDAHGAVGRLIEATEDIQQGGLAGSRRSHDGDPLPGFHGKADAVERFDRRCPAAVVCFRDVFQLDECHLLFSA